ncbi:MAG TPA: FAD-binding oxidoreductase [Thermoleophilaceae bacterium]|nr:FAD-binding oxidoreductase [Thermoleophilaceae bacterium]
MATRELRTEAPASRQEAAQLVAACGRDGRMLRVRGGGTKLGWGTPAPDPDVELSTAGLDRVVEHNEGDLTAILEAGVPLAKAQERFAAAGQMLALDPPLGDGERATIGGVVASGDSGPLRHRYGAPRDLVLGMTVALSDGTVAKSGSKVIKNVAGYDLAKLFAASFGTLGLILQVSVRLHPLPSETVTAVGRSDDPDTLARAAAELSHASLEKECVDVRWDGEGGGAVLARLGGATARAQADAALRVLGIAGEIVADDDELWAHQRARQRSAERAVVRVSGLQSELARTIQMTRELGGSLVGRASLGISWITLDPGRVADLRRALAPQPCVVLDAPRDLRASLDVWDAEPSPLAQRVKQRFDPAGIFAPGTFAGGI